MHVCLTMGVKRNEDLGEISFSVLTKNDAQGLPEDRIGFVVTDGNDTIPVGLSSQMTIALIALLQQALESITETEAT